MWKAKEWWPSLNSSPRKVYLRTHIPVSPWLLWRLVPHQFIARSIHSTYHKEAFIYFLQLVLNKSSIFISFLKGLSPPKPATALPVPDTDGFVKWVSMCFLLVFSPRFSALCIWNRTSPRPPPPSPPNPEGTSLPPSWTSSSFSKREIPRCTRAESLQKELGGGKKPKTNKIPNPFTPPKVTHVLNSTKSNRAAHDAFSSAKHCFRTQLCYSSYLKASHGSNSVLVLP